MIKTFFIGCIVAVSTLSTQHINSNLDCSKLMKDSSYEHLTVYTENCQPNYELIVGNNSSYLVSIKDETIVEKYSNDNNPYLKDKLEYLVYVEDHQYGYKHVGVLNDELFDLDNREVIEIPESARSGGTIADVLTYIDYSDIPSTATFCDMSYYFEHLSWYDELGYEQYGYGENIHNTCCIVSIQILFGYYNAIFNDNVVSDTYDRCSYEYEYYCHYFNMSPHTDPEGFHSHLTSLCNIYCGVNIEQDGGLSWLNQNHFINFYIGTVRHLNYTNFTSEGNLQDIFSNRHILVTKFGINTGRPVIFNNFYHSMVAIAYDSNYVYVMTGGTQSDFNNAFGKMSWNDCVGNIFTNCPAAYDLILQCGHYCPLGYYSTIMNRFRCPYGHQ